MYDLFVFFGKCVVCAIAFAFVGAVSSFIVHDVRPRLVAAIAQLRQRWIK